MNHTREVVRLASLAAIVFVALPAQAQRRFVATDIARKPLNGSIVISNDAHRITAVQTVGQIRKALVSLRSARITDYKPFGSVIYRSSAPVGSMLPPHLTQLVQEAAATHSVDPRLIAAVVRQESGFRTNAVSPVGALGLMQLMPATAKYLGVRDPLDPRENVMGGTKYLRTLLDVFNGDLDLALAAYNAGPGAVKKYRGIPPYAETRNYVAKIRRNYEASIN